MGVGELVSLDAHRAVQSQRHGPALDEVACQVSVCFPAEDVGDAEVGVLASPGVRRSVLLTA